MGAGNYYDVLRHQVRSVTKDTTTGQDVETFTDGDLLWGRIEPTARSSQTTYGAKESGADGTIYLRCMPDVSALDRLYAEEWEELWIIDNVVRGANEMICDVFRFTDLEV